ncbi:hypothetical protein ILYODFUR_018099 [Ilyodon furcidens]|uniref:Uncharacterized protein n=1 Tax=Ilyodon furcidens TaxID=33524 RepID=A0ABV0VEY0_9TELE
MSPRGQSWFCRRCCSGLKWTNFAPHFYGECCFAGSSTPVLNLLQPRTDFLLPKTSHSMMLPLPCFTKRRVDPGCFSY